MASLLDMKLLVSSIQSYLHNQFIKHENSSDGFDDQGSQYDSVGNLRNWWADETREEYLVKAQCIVDQYGSYIEPLSQLNLNGRNTQGENIADNGRKID